MHRIVGRKCSYKFEFHRWKMRNDFKQKTSMWSKSKQQRRLTSVTGCKVLNHLHLLRRCNTEKTIRMTKNFCLFFSLSSSLFLLFKLLFRFYGVLMTVASHLCSASHNKERRISSKSVRSNHKQSQAIITHMSRVKSD